MMRTPDRVLGLGCGQPHGSAEILLKAALRAAQGEGAAVELVRLDELRLPSGGAEDTEPDDAWWLWDRLAECDGLIVSTPIMSRTVTARLKLLGDRLLGPNADAAIIEGLLALRNQGQEPAVPFRIDGRVLKPRVAGFLAVGGSLTPQWKTLTLPMMHATTFSMHIAVVDQVQFGGAGFAGQGLGIYQAMEDSPIFSDSTGIIRHQQGFLGVASLTFGGTKIGGGVGETQLKKTVGEGTGPLTSQTTEFPAKQLGISIGVYQHIADTFVLALEYFRSDITWQEELSPATMAAITPSQHVDFVNAGITTIF